MGVVKVLALLCWVSHPQVCEHHHLQAPCCSHAGKGPPDGLAAGALASSTSQDSAQSTMLTDWTVCVSEGRVSEGGLRGP